MGNNSDSPPTTTSDGITNEAIKPPTPKFITRTQLPSRCSKKNGSIWSVLKRSIGKDLSRVTIPITFNEPLSFLQRLAECMEYVELIKKAAITPDPVKRMEMVTAFALSTLASTNVRLSKPFNPLLYETYELPKPELGFKYVAEQVSHHPPISAFHSQGDQFEFYGNVEPRVKFWGRSLEDTPQADFTLILKTFDETYNWQALSCCVNNLFMGKMYLSLNGTMNVKCPKNDLKSEIKFTAANGADTMLNGEIYQGKEQIRAIYGNWTEYIASTSISIFQELKSLFKKEYRNVEKSGNTDLITLFPDSRLLWRIHKKPSTNKDYYFMTYYALMLNEMVPDPSKLPRTDSRFRPDIRLMEEGNIDAGQMEKNRLEENQRCRAKQKSATSLAPRWFGFGKDKGSERNDFYFFNGRYWNRDYTKSEDIFGED